MWIWSVSWGYRSMSNRGVCRVGIIDVYVVSDNDVYMIINVILIVWNWEGKIGGVLIDLLNGWDRGESLIIIKLYELL